MKKTLRQAEDEVIAEVRALLEKLHLDTSDAAVIDVLGVLERNIKDTDREKLKTIDI